MVVVIFEVEPAPGKTAAYFDLAATLRPQLENCDGFISIERFESVTTPGKFVSISFWRDEAAVTAWRNVEQHRDVQAKGRNEIFANYRIRVASVTRDYGMNAREGAPADSRAAHA